MKKLTVALCTFSVLLFLTSMIITTQEGYKVGDTAENFELKNVDGNMVSLSDYPDAKGYIVIFTCNHCPYSKLYEDRIIALNDTYSDKGYPVIAINPNDPEVQPQDSYENMIKRADEKGFNFPYLFDSGQNVYPVYGAERTPHVFLLDNERVVRYIGAIDDNPRNPEAVEVKYVEDAIKALENNQDPDPSLTKAIGCTIKSK